MKRSFSRFRLSRLSSFTLVELLVVIGIIAILASVLIYSAGAAIRAAKRAQANNMANQIQTATIAYYTEYSFYPTPYSATATDTTITDVAGSQTSWGNLIEALCGNIKPSTGSASSQTSITNSRGIAFLNLKSSDVDSKDAPLNPLPTGGEIYYNIAIDSDYDGILGVTPSAVTTMPNFAAASGSTLPSSGGTSTAGVAVWANCNGKTTSTNVNFWVHTY